MNEVKLPAITSPLVARPASSPGAVKTQEQTEDKNLPKVNAEEASTQAPLTEKKEAQAVENAVASMQEYAQSVQRDLHFTVDKDLDSVVIKVVDGGSGELIRQIPEEAFLELARKLNEQGEFQLIDALG